MEMPMPFCEQKPQVQARVLVALAAHLNAVKAQGGLKWGQHMGRSLRQTVMAALAVAGTLECQGTDGGGMGGSLDTATPTPGDLPRWSALLLEEQAEHLRQISRWGFDQLSRPKYRSPYWLPLCLALERGAAELADYLSELALDAATAQKNSPEEVTAWCPAC